jgi:FxLD family lantipeptide
MAMLLRAELHGDQVDGADPFELNVRFVEFGDVAQRLIAVTDDGRGTTRAKARATSAG